MGTLEHGFAGSALIWGLVVLFGAGGAGGFNKGNPAKNGAGVKKSRADGDKPGETDRDRAADRVNDPFLVIVLGDTVRSNTLALGLKKIQFEAISGTRVDLHLKCEASGVAPPMKVKAPSGTIVADVASKAATSDVEIRGLDLNETGLFTVVISGVAVDVANCELTTSAVYPRRIDRAFDLIDGRPVTIPLGGMCGRLLTELRVDVDPAAKPQLDLVAELRDPRGEKIDLADRLKIAPDGSSFTLSREHLDQIGDFKLSVTDKKRGTAKLRVKGLFENPPLSSKTHTLF